MAIARHLPSRKTGDCQKRKRAAESRWVIKPAPQQLPSPVPNNLQSKAIHREPLDGFYQPRMKYQQLILYCLRGGSLAAHLLAMEARLSSLWSDHPFSKCSKRQMPNQSARQGGLPEISL